MKKSNVIWPNTKIIELLKITIPIIQAPMAGGATTPELVAEVSNAGGLGSLGAGYMTADEIKTTIKKIKVPLLLGIFSGCFLLETLILFAFNLRKFIF